jgi:hypothetical protein
MPDQKERRDCGMSKSGSPPSAIRGAAKALANESRGCPTLFSVDESFGAKRQPGCGEQPGWSGFHAVVLF